MLRDQAIQLLRDNRASLARLGVARLFLYGSVARDHASAESDVDFLIAAGDDRFSWPRQPAWHDHVVGGYGFGSLERGLTIFDLQPQLAAADLAQWAPILQWLKPQLYPPQAANDGSTVLRPPARTLAPKTAVLPKTVSEEVVSRQRGALPNVMRGEETQIWGAGLAELMAWLQAGQLQPLISRRYALAETPQYKNVDIGTWFALMAPANLPKPVFDKLKKALADSLQSPDFKKKMEASGSTVAAPTVNIDQFLATEVAKYKKIVEFAKIEE